MKIHSRPSVHEMIFRLYTRPIHPELFETVACRRVRQADWQLTACITATGHFLTWSNDQVCFAEITGSVTQDLPRTGTMIGHRFEGERRGRLNPIGGIRYQMISQVEKLEPEIYLHIHEEILADGAKRGLLHSHHHHNRLALSPLGFIAVEAWKNTLSINTIHTFPNERAVVKTQSLIERE